MLLIISGIMLVLYALFQTVFYNGMRFWKDALFWMLLVAAGFLSMIAIAGGNV
jgi:hypothetical protein